MYQQSSYPATLIGSDNLHDISVPVTDANISGNRQGTWKKEGIKSIYVIGSLRNPEVPILGNRLRNIGLDVFDDWYGAGDRADDHWQEYEKHRGRSYLEALEGRACNSVFEFDRRNLLRVDSAVLLYPAGKSGHLELGFAIGSGKRGYIILEGEPDRYDVMLRFAEKVFVGQEQFMEYIKGCL